jgi:NAD(P) transhydrogenase
LGLLALLTESSAELFNQACFNYPTLGDLYKYATYDALLTTFPGEALPPQRARLPKRAPERRI